MRLFVAVELEPSLRRDAAAAGARLAAALRRGMPGGRADISWVPPDNLHLTLRFLGEVEEARAIALADRFPQPIAVDPFEIELAGVGVFPPSGSPRVVWIGVTLGREALTSLAAQVEERLASWGFGREARPFQAHLTLGRCRQPLGPRARDLLVEVAVAAVGKSRIDRVVLFESRLSSGPATYVRQAVAPLVS